jgi:hypothetical protein
MPAPTGGMSGFGSLGGGWSGTPFGGLSGLNTDSVFGGNGGGGGGSGFGGGGGSGFGGVIWGGSAAVDSWSSHGKKQAIILGCLGVLL